MRFPWTLVKKASLAEMIDKSERLSASMREAHDQKVSLMSDNAELSRLLAALVLNENRSYRIVPNRKLAQASRYDIVVSSEGTTTRISLVDKPVGNGVPEVRRG